MKHASKSQIVEELIETYEMMPKVKGVLEDERFYEGYLEALEWVLGFIPPNEREEEEE